MPWCQRCGKKNPPEQDYIFESYDGEYFCDDECRNTKRKEEESFGSF